MDTRTMICSTLAEARDPHDIFVREEFRDLRKHVESSPAAAVEVVVELLALAGAVGNLLLRARAAIDGQDAAAAEAVTREIPETWADLWRHQAT